MEYVLKKFSRDNRNGVCFGRISEGNIRGLTGILTSFMDFSYVGGVTF